MFNLLKDNTADVKKIRSSLLQFIKEKLQRAEGGEGASINGIYLFINCTDEERYLYEGAVFATNPNRFKEEVQRVADDYDITLPAFCKYEVTFTDKYPDRSYISTDINAALFISTKKAGITHKKTNASIKILSGHTEKNIYHIHASAEKINIGREIQTQLAGGFVRKNTIAFIAQGSTDVNRSVSRQHAHIEWDTETSSFLIFADEGGIPPYNKMKIRKTDGSFIKMQAIEVGHRLEESDQVILGDTAVLEFTYFNNDY